jgi:hypothetical protein
MTTIIRAVPDDGEIVQRERKPRFILYNEVDPTIRKEWLVGGLLGNGEASATYGIPGCGKSVLMQDMGLHIAAGEEWHGRSVQRGAVLYVALERFALVKRRSAAFRIKYGLDNLPFAMLGGVHDFREPTTSELMIDCAKQVDHLFGLPVVLVIIDTLSRALCGGDENSSKDMGAIIAATSRLQLGTKAHIMWLHHMPVDGSERLRGHGALLGAMDTTLHVEKSSGDTRMASVVKANDSDEGERVAFTLESITICEDTTAPVVIEANAGDIRADKPRRKLPDRAKLALQALTEAVIARGKPAPEDMQLAADIKVVTLDEWRDELYRANILNKAAANPWADFGRVQNQLAAREIIGCRNDLVWVV